MKLSNRPAGVLGHLLIAALLSLGLCLPATANNMWKALFNEHMENAKAGEPDAQYELGIMYLKGQGVAQDRDEAVKWLKAAAASGHPLAEGKLTRIEEQEEKFEQLKSSADAGDLEAQYELAMMYLKGRGVKTDGDAALRYLRKAADKGDERAITRLGIVTFKGEAGKADYKQALSLFNRVSAKSVLAQYYLGEMYASGSGVKQDYGAAIDWYKKAADGGFNRAAGKIINLEEEQKTEQRRKANAAKRAQAERAELAPARQAEQAEQAKQSEERKQAEARSRDARSESLAKASRAPTKQVVARKPAPKPKAKSKPKRQLTGLDKLADSQWLRNKRPVDYLPSRVTRCDRDDDRLVCFSEVLHRTRGAKVVEYRVKSIISEKDAAYSIIYRNLVLDVTDAQEPEDQPLGYDDQLAQGFHVKTGWTAEHRVLCKQTAKRSMACDKDDRYQITLVAEN